jgi:hypothetical protein
MQTPFDYPQNSRCKERTNGNSHATLPPFPPAFISGRFSSGENPSEKMP